jgi:hypothetical protein
MKQISIEQLQANAFYWARRKPTHNLQILEPVDLEVVRISTVFGSAREFWTVAVPGTDEHFDLEAYEFLHRVPAPPSAVEQRSPLTLVTSNSRSVGH